MGDYQQLPLTFFDEKRGELGWTRTMTRYLPDGRVYGIKESSLDSWSQKPRRISMTQTAWDDYKEYISRFPEGSWNWEVALQWVGMGWPIRKRAGSALVFSPDDTFLAVVPDNQWLRPIPRGTIEPLAEILRVGDACPAIAHFTNLEIIRQFPTRKISAALCDSCWNCEDRSRSFVVCTWEDSERLYPKCGWGPEYPRSNDLLSRVKTNDYILAHWIDGKLWLIQMAENC